MAPTRRTPEKKQLIPSPNSKLVVLGLDGGPVGGPCPKPAPYGPHGRLMDLLEGRQTLNQTESEVTLLR